MTIAPWQAAKIEAFLDSGSGFRHLLNPYLSLVALRADDANVLIAARLIFASPTALLVEKAFDSPSVKARAFPLESGVAEQLISEVASGFIEIGGEAFLFPSAEGAETTIEFEPFHQGANAQTRFSVLTMRGRTTGGLQDNQKLDWEVKAASTPYLSFEELLLEFGVPVPQGIGTFETFHALPIVVDNERSRLHGKIASISLKVERGIEPSDVQLGLIAIKTGESAHRQNVPGGSLRWEDDGQFAVGSFECEVPAGRAVQAIASLRGTAFHYWWVVDPLQIPNTRKAVYEVVDPNLAILTDFMVASGSKGSARDLESAIAWLLWMLGFSVAHLGTNTRTQDAVDILATTPSGDVLMVECTTGVISTDKKVANLLSRKAVVLEKLARASQNQVRVLPVIVTSKGREEVAQEIVPAQKRGVLILTRDDLVEMLNRTDMFPNADQLYNEAEQQLSGSV